MQDMLHRSQYSFVLKSEVDMLKMWVHKRTRAEHNPSNDNLQ